MRFRKLRIAFSAACLIACVVLIVLWVRSIFFACDGVWLRMPDRWVAVVQSRRGGVGFGISTKERVGVVLWQFASRPPDTPSDIDYLTALGVGVCMSPSRGHYFVRIPDWLSILSIGTASIILIKRTNLRFSLRTLLIATTLVAVVLGLIVWMSRTG